MAAICVFCGSSTTVDSGYLRLAAEAGAALAAAGHTLVSGGGKVGMMGAVAAAARAGGARTVGVIPQVLYGAEVADTESDELLVTADMAERKTLMVAKSDAFLALPGGVGTMDELFEVWTTAFLGVHTKPVVLLSLDGFYDRLLSFVDDLVARHFLSAASRDKLMVAETVPDALARLAAALGQVPGAS